MTNTPGGVRADAWTATRMGTRGAVVSNHPLSSLAGMEMLRAGGNAVDAAVAVAFALGVAEPQGSGIAADGFLMVHMKERGTVEVANGCGFAPMAATPERFKDGIVTTGPLSTSVPGICDALLAAHARYGRLPLEQVVAPAIEWCEAGVPQTFFQCRLAQKCDLMHRDAGAAAVFAPDGKPLAPGGLRRNPDLAWTYREIVKGGRDAFYTGPIADKLAAYMEAAGGILTKDDLAAYHMRWEAPITTTYRGRTVYEAPPNSSGHVLLQELNLIEGFDMASLGLTTPEAVHLMVEAKKLAFADREAYLADPDVVDVPIEGLISKEYAAERAKLIDLERAAEGVAEGDPWAFQDRAPDPAKRFHRPGAKSTERDGETTHYCVVDAEGNAVDGLQSLSSSYGSQVICPGTGMLLNNRMNYWHLEAEHADLLQPGKRVRQTMNPVMVFTAPPEQGGQLDLCCGTPGADTQVQTNLQLISAIYDQGYTVTEAIHAPRWTHVQGRMTSSIPRQDEHRLNVEDRFGAAAIADLDRRGHAPRPVGEWGGPGSAGAIRVLEGGTLTAAADPRRDGQALVY